METPFIKKVTCAGVSSGYPPVAVALAALPVADRFRVFRWRVLTSPRHRQAPALLNVALECSAALAGAEEGDEIGQLLGV